MTPSRSSPAAPSSGFAVSLLGELRLLGVKDVVLSPGSRSQALALAVAEYERLELLRLHVRIDERVAGFVALGLAVETGVPVVVVTTSGTAVANLHPAVLEAHHSGVPLIVITADRPNALRGIGSNQTAEQPGIFGPAITRSFEVGAPVGEAAEADVAAIVARQSWSAALSGTAFGPGPVHVNVAFAEPLSGPTEIAALHDAGSLALGVGERRPRVQVIVGNDGGGTIFDGLEVAGTAPMAALDRVLLTPQRVAFDSLAAAYGWEYLRVTNRGELDEALAASVGPMLIEVPLAR